MTVTPTESDPVVVVGGGMGGGRAAEFLAMRGKLSGRIVLLSEERDLPYHRPLLSKYPAVAREGADVGESVPGGLYFRDVEFYAAKGIGLRLGQRATGLDTQARVIETDTGGEFAYSQLLIATGCSPRRLRVEGADLGGVHHLKSLQDARGFWTESLVGGPVVIVGAGFIGCEVASTLSRLGVDVTVVEALSEPLAGVLGTEVGRRIRAMHEQEGSSFLMNAQVEQLLGTDQVSGVVLSDGTVLPATTVLVCVGVQPNVEWLEGSGIAVDDGVLVDDFCRTSAAQVFAAGDVARWHHWGFGPVRIEHESNAQAQAVSAARNMLGAQIAHRSLPYVWSDQCGLRIEYFGHARTWDRVKLDDRSHGFSATYLKNGQVWAVLTVGSAQLASAARGLLQDGPAPLVDWCPTSAASV